jgi:hypothetical protein
MVYERLKLENGVWLFGLVAMLIVLVSLMALPASAQPTADQFGIPDVQCDPGTEISVPVSITNAQHGPIISQIFDIRYDTDILKVTEVQRGDLTASWDAPSFNQFEWGTRVSIVYDGNVAHAILDGATGSVVILKFQVAYQPGTTSELTLSDIQLSDTAYTVGTAPSKDGRVIVSGQPLSPRASASTTPPVTSTGATTPPGTLPATPVASPKEPGFEAAGALTGLILIAYLILRRLT